MNTPPLTPDTPGAVQRTGSARVLVSPPEFASEMLTPIKRPCDYSLDLAISALETQLGTIEAYNRLVAAAQFLRITIDLNAAMPPSAQFLTDVTGKNFGESEHVTVAGTLAAAGEMVQKINAVCPEFHGEADENDCHACGHPRARHQKQNT